MSMDDSANTSAAASTPALPDDPVVLKQMIAELLATLRDRDRQCDQLRHRLDQLLRRLYGPRAEKFDPNQPWLFPELAQLSAATEPGATEPAAQATPAEAATPVKKKNGHGRRRLPDSLPRIRQTHDLSETECACPECGS